MRKPMTFNWRMFFFALGVVLWLGVPIGPALLLAGFVEVVVDIIADAIVAAKIAKA